MRYFHDQLLTSIWCFTKTAYKPETPDSITGIAPELRAEQVYGGLQGHIYK